METGVDRRTFMAGGVALALDNGSPTSFQRRDAQQLAKLRARWVGILTGNGYVTATASPYDGIIAGVEATAEKWRRTMAAPQGDPAFLWQDSSSKPEEAGYNTRISVDRLRVMALAWGTSGSRVYHDAGLAKQLINSLRWVEKHRYGAGVERRGNWWEWEIGIPIALLDILILMHDELRLRAIDLLNGLSSAVARFVANPSADTGANRVWHAHVLILHALVTNQSGVLESGRNLIPDVFQVVKDGDGFRSDGSFIQHRDLAYTGGYGRELLIRATMIFYLLDASSWRFSRDQLKPVVDVVHRSFSPLMYRGAVMDMVRGRNVSRAYVSDVTSGHTICVATLYLAATLRDLELLALVRTWLGAPPLSASLYIYDPNPPSYWLTPHMAWLLKGALAVSRPAHREETVAFAQMDRLVHHRPGYTAAVSLNSTRIRNVEIINGEDLKGWYGGRGLTLYRPDRPNYAEDYWPTVDPYRLPGITLDKRPREAGKEAGRNESPQVGVLAYKGVGLASMLNATDGGSFAAQVSWFLLGDAILCVGSGITSGSDLGCETIVSNEIVDFSFGSVDADTGRLDLRLDESVHVQDCRWMHLGLAGGVVFIHGGNVQMMLDRRIHAWSEINRQGASPTDPRTRTYRTVWLDHGQRPTAASYAYVLLPNSSLERTRRWASAPEIRLTECSPVSHVMTVDTDGRDVTAFVFWKAGRTTGGVEASGPLLMIVTRLAQAVVIAVQDPVHAEAGSITLSLPETALRLVKAEQGITVTRDGKTTFLKLDRSGLKGRTLLATFSIDG